MPINDSLLVSAAMMQDYFVDNITAEAMSRGVITMYKDDDRMVLKPWYYQSGNFGNYTYLPLDNPLTLSDFGTIVDPFGNDVIPFYYPFADDNQSPEFYYITVDNKDGQRQFTRANFPYLGQGGSGPTPPPPNVVPTLRNYIVNNRFWRNIGMMDLTDITSTTVNTTLSPSQHDGFFWPDFQFIKNVAGAIETVTFNKFPLDTILTNDITPEYYLNHNCTSEGGGEVLKVYQFPISLHVETLEDVIATVTIQAQHVSGANNITLFIFQHLGTGSVSPVPIALNPPITLLPGWTKFTRTFTFPPGSASLGSGGDDAFYLQIGMPLSETFNINFAIPSLYLTDATILPTNTFDTYDQVDAIINSPRTGDIRTSINSFAPFGWVPMNDGTIGNLGSNATTRENEDTWQLFNLLWNVARPYDSGSNFNPICQMYDNAGMAINFNPGLNFTTAAITDFDSENQLALTKMFGRVIMGTVPLSTLLPPFKQAISSITNNGGFFFFTVPSTVGFYFTMPVTLATGPGGVLPTALSSNAIYYITSAASSPGTFYISATLADAIIGNPIAVGGSTLGTLPINMFSQVNGSTIGEATHVLTVRELAAHNHFVSTITAPGSNATCISTTSSTPFTSTSMTGGNQPHNNIQLSTFYNIFMKL
jgi:hypothetical protein